MAWTYTITDSYSSMTAEQKEENARAFWSKMRSEMTIEAASGILGNMERESYINPGQLQGGSGTIDINMLLFKRKKSIQRY